MRAIVAWAVVMGFTAAWLGWSASGAGAQATGNAQSTQVPGVTVVIDPGHGGDDPGTVGAGGTEEKELTLLVAQRIKTLLAARPGFRAVLTREDDRRLSADQRAALANGVDADFYVSLHGNSSPSPLTAGFEVASFQGASEPSRGTASPDNQPALLQVHGGPPRRVTVVRWDRAQIPHQERAALLAMRLGAFLGSVGMMGPRGVYRAPLRLLNAVNAPAVLVELGYLSNGEDEAAMGAEERQAAVAQAVLSALEGMAGPAAR